MFRDPEENATSDGVRVLQDALAGDSLSRKVLDVTALASAEVPAEMKQ